MFFWNSLAFSMIQRMLAIWSLVPLPFLKPAWTSGSSRFMYCWNSSTLATSCEELTHWKRLRCWEGLGAGGEGDDRGWDGWMASPTQWTWVWVSSGSWWWTGRPGVLRFMGSQRVGHDWATELNSTELWHWRRVLRVPWRSNESVLKEINPELEGLMLLRLPIWCK